MFYLDVILLDFDFKDLFALKNNAYKSHRSAQDHSYNNLTFYFKHIYKMKNVEEKLNL